MAKFGILIPIPHVQPPDERLMVAWVQIYRSNDTDEFAQEVGLYLGQCLPIRLKINDLTSGEKKHLDDMMAKMQKEVNKQLLTLGLPLPQVNYRAQTGEDAP